MKTLRRADSPLIVLFDLGSQSGNRTLLLTFFVGEVLNNQSANQLKNLDEQIIGEELCPFGLSAVLPLNYMRKNRLGRFELPLADGVDNPRFQRLV